MESKANPAESLSEVIQWACAPRGGNNFYGRVLNGCGRTMKEGIQTAAVTLTNEGKYMFLWDPEFFSSQPMALRILAVMHEAAHIVLQHLERTLRLSTITKDRDRWQRMRPLMQTAADMAANDIAIRPFIETSTFKEFKAPLLFPENEPYHFPQKLSFEEYLELLLDKSKKEGYDPVTGEGKAPQWLQQMEDTMFPKHIPWEDMVEGMTDAEIERIAERARREAKGIVKKAHEQTMRSRGTIPGGLQGIIDELLKEPTVPWEVLLQGMLRNAVASKLQESTAWPNTALMAEGVIDDGIEPYPGFQKDFEFHIAVAIDTSGSVSDSDFVDFLSEIQGIQKTNKAVSIQMIMFDAAIQHEFLMEENDKVERFTTRYGYGGTDFTAPMKRVLGVDEESDWEPDAESIKNNIPSPDLFVMFTDGYAPVGEDRGGPIPKYLPPCPLIWVITPDGAVDDAMGDRVVKITGD